tara:strand:+ start:5442 stop:6752 length:1311 start_codon:yes stop_codon:yes gene_type:complete
MSTNKIINNNIVNSNITNSNVNNSNVINNIITDSNNNIVKGSKKKPNNQVKKNNNEEDYDLQDEGDIIVEPKPTPVDKKVNPYDSDLKKCTYEIKDISNLPWCISNKLIDECRIDFEKNICIIDLSYLTFTRFFGIRIWYINAYEKKDYPADYDWCKDKLFMEKFEKLFFKKLFIYCSKNNIPETNIIFTTDCSSEYNWRLSLNTKYKETRKESHKNNKFHNFEIFSFVKKVLVKPFQDKNGNLVFSHKNLEADDLVHLSIKYLREKKDYKNKIIILANDRDYVQICNDTVQLVDFKNKEISKDILAKENISGKDYLLIKVLSGDTSDNIASCYINKSFLSKAGVNTKKDYLKGTFVRSIALIRNDSTKKLLYDLLDYSRQEIKNKPITFNENEISYFKNITQNNQFIKNLKIIDFDCIPENYHNHIFENVLHNCF